MKCPVCGKEMTEGFLQAPRAVYFSEEQLEHFFIRPNEKIALLTRNNLDDPKGIAWRCADCKKVVVDYTDIPQSNLKSLF